MSLGDMKDLRSVYLSPPAAPVDKSVDELALNILREARTKD